MIKRLLVLGILTFFVNNSFSASLSGFIFDKDTNKTLEGAHVQIKGTHKVTTTSSDGSYFFNELNKNEVSIFVSHIAYRHEVLNIKLNSDQNTSYDVFLSKGAHELDEVVYTATRSLQLLKDVPVSTELLSQKEIEQTASFNAAEALQSQIGVDIRDDFSGKGIAIQGVDPERVLILVDGNRVIGRINGSIDLGQISTQGIKQIEIVKGAISTLYGSEAIGGVVNIITDNSETPLEISAQIASGGYLPNSGSKAPKFEAGIIAPSLDASYSGKKFGLRGGINYSKNGIMDLDSSTDHTEGTEAADKINSYTRFHYNLNEKMKLIASGHLNHEEKKWVEDAGLQSVQVSYDDEEINKSNDQSLEYQYIPGWGEQYSVKLYRSYNDHEWTKYTQNPRHRKDLSQSIEDYTEFSSQFTRNVGSYHKVTTGFDYGV